MNRNKMNLLETMDNDILIVDDEILNLQLLAELLTKEGYQVRAAERPQLAIDSALAQPPSLILLDVRMPEIDGFAVCRHLKQDERTCDVPIIFISALQDVSDRIEGFNAGAVDFISKPFQPLEVLARVKTHLQLRHMQLHLEEMVAERTSDLEATNNALQETDDLLQESQALGHLGSFVGDLKSGQGRWSDEVYRIFGYSPGEVIPTYELILDHVHPDDREGWVKANQAFLSGNAPYDLEYRIIRKDGEVGAVRSVAALKSAPSGKSTYTVGMLQDITERKLAEQEKEKLLHDIRKRLKELNCIYSVSNAIKENDSLDDIFQTATSCLPDGWQYPEITRGKIQYNGKDYVHEPFKETNWKQASPIVIEGKNCGYVAVYYLELRPSLDEGPFMTEERELIENVARVLSESISHRRAEEAMRESENRFRSTFEQAAVGIAHVSTEGHFLRINQKFCDIVGYSHSEMLERTFQDITFPEDFDRDLKHVNQLLEGETKNYSVEKRYIRKNGELVWVQLTVSLVRNETGEPQWFTSVIMDISERKQIEEKLEKYQQRLKSMVSQLTVVEEKERRRIAADLHDHVGQSLALSRIQIDIIQKTMVDFENSKSLDEISETIKKAIQDTRHLVFELSSPLMNEIGLTAAVSDWMEEKIEKRHGIKTELIVKGEKKRLDNDLRAILFRNIRELATNVVKHARASNVTVGIDYSDTFIKITIIDDGVGFDKNLVLEKSANEKKFGLFLIDERMTDFGGSFEIKSEPGKGCTVVLEVPSE